MTKQMHRRRLLGLLSTLVALGLTAAACGSDDQAIEDTDLPVENDDEARPDDEDTVQDGVTAGGNEPGVATPGYTLLTPRSDLVSLQPAAPREIIVDPDDDRQLLLHFQGAAEPCSGASVAVEETETSVIIDLQVGLDPNAAAMSCIAQVFDYEVVLPLEAPLADRTINVAG